MLKMSLEKLLINYMIEKNWIHVTHQSDFYFKYQHLIVSNLLQEFVRFDKNRPDFQFNENMNEDVKNSNDMKEKKCEQMSKKIKDLEKKLQETKIKKQKQEKQLKFYKNYTPLKLKKNEDSLFSYSCQFKYPLESDQSSSYNFL